VELTDQFVMAEIVLKLSEDLDHGCTVYIIHQSWLSL
jgi:hypothetical protein